MPKRTIPNTKVIDDSIVEKISEYGIEKDVIVTHINENRHNMITTTYYLL
jgi:hypothetical protein